MIERLRTDDAVSPKLLLCVLFAWRRQVAGVTVADILLSTLSVRISILRVFTLGIAKNKNFQSIKS